MLIARLFRRDFGGVATALGAMMLPVAAALASLGEGMGPAVMAVSLLSAAASLLGILTAMENVMDDREGWMAPYVTALGRWKYAALRAAVSTAVSVAAVLPASAFYGLIRPASALPVSAATALSAAAGAAVGLLLGFSASTRGYAYAWGIAAWTALALVYEVVLTFILLYFPVSELFAATALLANPLTAARLTGVALADPHLLTLGAVGDYLHRSLGVYAAYLFPAAAALWIAAAVAASLLEASRRDL